MESLRLGKWSQCWAIPHFCTYLIPQYIRERISCWRSEVCLYTQPFIQSSIDQSMNQSINHESIYHKSQTPNLVTPRFRQLRHPQDAAFDPMVSCYEDKICMRWIQYKYIYIYICIYVLVRSCSCTRTCICMHTYVSYPTRTGTSTCENGAYLGITWVSWTLKSYSVDREFYHRSTTRKRDFHQGFGLRSGAYWNVSLGSETAVDELVILGRLNPKKTDDLQHDMENSPDNPRVNESGYGMRFEAVNKIVG